MRGVGRRVDRSADQEGGKQMRETLIVAVTAVVMAVTAVDVTAWWLGVIG